MIPGRYFSSLIFACMLMVPGHPVFCGMAATGTVGVQARSGFQNMNFGYSLSGYYKFDDQVLLGVQSGQGVAGDATAVPLLAAAYVRLPVGKVIVPVATGGAGYAFSSYSVSSFLWRAGGAFDIRNGRRSSILIGSEYEGHGNYSGILLRAGLMLEL